MLYIEQAGITLSTEMTRGRGIYCRVCGVVLCISVTVKKRLTTFPPPAGMSITKLSLGGNMLLFPPRRSKHLLLTSNKICLIPSIGVSGYENKGKIQIHFSEMTWHRRWKNKDVDTTRDNCVPCLPGNESYELHSYH